MNEIERWLQRQAAKEQRSVLLEEGLLGDRLGKYARYRLRYFFINFGVDTAVHTITVLFLFRLHWGNFLPILIAHAAVSLGSSFWWGALEAMRGQVRDLHRSGKPRRMAQVIGGWLAFSVVLALGLVVLAGGWITWHALGAGFGAPEAYVAVLLLRLAAELPSRCYHSGIYALRRVYKPFVAVIGPQLIELVIIVTAFRVLGLWALVIASVIVTTLLTLVTVRYTGKVYRFIGVVPRPQFALPLIRRSLRGTGREALQAGAANTVIALDSLVVFAVLYGAGRRSEALVVLFLIMPSIRASADWARLFYFDLKKLELRLFTNLRVRFERHSARVAWLLAVGFWAVAASVATAFYGRALHIPYLSLLVFFLSRSLLARVQVQAFAEGAYAPILATGTALVAGLVASNFSTTTDDARLTAIALVTAACASLLSYLRRRTAARGDPGEALLTLEWLRRLGAITEPVRVGSARVLPASGPDRVDARTLEDQVRWRLNELADRTARRLGDHGAAAWLGPDRLVWFELADGPEHVPTTWLQFASGGLVAEAGLRSCPSGEEALLTAGHSGLLGPASSHLLTPVLPVDVAEARLRFAGLFPGGIAYSPREPIPTGLAALSASELRAILADAVAFARDLGVRRRRSNFDVTTLCAGGELQLIFVVALNTDKKTRGKWRLHVTRLNVRAAIGGARERAAARSPLHKLSALRPAARPAENGHVPAGGLLTRRRKTSPLIDCLRRVPLLSELSSTELERVAAAMTERRFGPGDAITEEGQPGVGFYVISDGHAGVSINGHHVRDLGPGDHFGEIALVAESPRTATVTATTDLVSHRMTSWEFRKLIERSASISWHVLQSTLRRLHQEGLLDAPSTTGEPASARRRSKTGVKSIR